MTRALGRYELLRPLARGGMAEVYLARRRAGGIEKWLVVKRMRPERSRDPRFLDLFVREARLSMSLVHQNIVPVFDFGRIDDQVFLAMERVEGKDLGSSLARAATHRVPPLLAAFIAAECCQALDYAHQRKGPDGVALGIVHRDVTPRNVLLSWSGEVKLTDFGIAALAGDATQRLLGTPQYMAPEQARGEPIDPRADVYAVGLVLREAVTGVRPRPGDDRNAILGAARQGALLPWSHLADPITAPPGVDLALGSDDLGPPVGESRADPPPALVAIIDRATAADAGGRYPDARSMLEDLDTFIVGQRAAYKAESPARQLAAWLASVWEGARDDIETDATIEAEHLVSFLDDGALDVIGTGTVRSMAATAADDAQLGLATVDATIPPEELAADEPSPGPGDAPPRRLSSSTSTVASGSFDAIPGPGEANRRDRSTTIPVRPPPQRIARFVIPAVLITAAITVSFVVSRLRERNRASVALSTPAPSSAAQPRIEPPPAVPPNPGVPVEPPTAEPPSAQPPAAVSPTAEPPPADAGRPRPPRSGASTTGRPTTRQPNTVPPNSGPSNHGQSRDGPSNIGPSNVGQPNNGSSNSQSRDAHQGLCRVRINLTPWAYYTADDDPTRHETPGTIELTPGPHRLHVWNPELHIERDITILVPADRETMNYSEPLQPSTLTHDAGAPR